MKGPSRNVAMILLVGWLLVVSSEASAGPVQIVDDAGETVSLAEPARRIIPLYGAFAEMLFAVGAGSKVIARTQADQFPAEIVKLPSVGTHMKPNVEMIIGLKPDLVIQSASRHEAIGEMERLRSAHIPVAVFDPRTFAEIFSVLQRVGALSGCEAGASEAAAQLAGRLDMVQSRLRGLKEKRRVFFEVRAEPLTGAGRSSIVQGILAAAGAENVLGSEKAIVQYNLERLLMDDPDVYIVQKGPMNRNPLDPDKRAHFDRLRSVREGKIIYVDEFIYSRPGPRCVDAVEQLARDLYPERFKGD